MIAAMFIAADLLGLGHSISSFGQTLALLLTFLGVGVIANVLIIYAIVQVLAERRQNRERIDAYDRSQPREAR
jgi:energy-converting hydrogenase Eha subunit E